MVANLTTSEDFLDQLFEERETAVARDLKLNLKKLLGGASLDATEAPLALLALASASGPAAGPLATYAREALAARDLTREQIREAAESAAIMTLLNGYYKFRGMIANDEDYGGAGLRMTALASPGLGKERFEMLAFAVSCLNGCQSCIRSHEKVLRDAGVPPAKLHDLARLAATVRATTTLLTLPPF